MIRKAVSRALVALAALLAGGAIAARAADYRPIDPAQAGRTITLTGHDLTIDEVVQIARFGAKVAIDPAAKRRQGEAYDLIIEASAEGIPIYGFNRGSGAGREISLFKGDPLGPENADYIDKHIEGFFEEGPRLGFGPEVSDEEIVRAMMAVRCNTMIYEAASPAMSDLLVAMLNDRIAPVIQSRGSLGEADLAQVKNLLGAMGGKGEAYLRGVRMPAAQALREAGLTPLRPIDAVYTSSLTSTNAYSVGQAVLLVADAKRALDWADLLYAMDLDAMNSSITPLAAPVQANKPFQWANLDAARILDMLRGGYLFDDDPARIIQDPESLRASFSRQGGAWKAWATLRDTLLLQINASDHNPAVLVGVSPADSWELSTPQMMKYYVKGGPRSHGQHGYVLSNAAWDPYPMANEIEAFTNALANMDVAVTERIYRFTSPFFTVITPAQVLTPDQRAKLPPEGAGYDATAIWQDLLTVAAPVTPAGNPVSGDVEELQAQTFQKVTHARKAVDDTFRLLGDEMLTASYWLDLRRVQAPARQFGAAPTAAWTAFRKAVPWQQDYAARPEHPESELGYAFLMANPASSFYPPAAAPMDKGHPPARP